MSDQPVDLAHAIGGDTPILLDPLRLDEFAALWLKPAFDAMRPAASDTVPGALARPRRTVH